MHGAAYVVRDVPGEPDVHYALAEDRSLGARLVGRKDREVWRLDRARLAESMRADLGATAVEGPNVVVIDGVLDLGIFALKTGKLRFVYAMAKPPKGWMSAARRACGLGVTLVVLVPRGHGTSDGALEIELDVAQQFGLAPIGRVLGHAAQALGVEDEVEPRRLCDEDVVVDRATQRVWVLGVLVALTERPYGLLHELARNGGALVATKEAGARISRSGAPDVTARKAKAEAEKQIREALVDAGVSDAIVDRMIVVEGKKGYRLGVSARVL
jgi:hypothetical protein